MNISKHIFMTGFLVVALLSNIANAQTYPMQTVTPVYQQPIYSVTPPAIGSLKSYSPLSVCNCNQPNGDCKCKNLDCKIKLPSNCTKKTVASKTPIPCKIYGKIPIYKYNSNCLVKECDFQYQTEVPQIQCGCEECVEIGTKLVQCLPGCCFNVCVPTFCCKTQSVKCELILKEMPMQLWQRTENGRTVYDVYVINNPAQDSPFFAGGMPAKWVIMHCGTRAEFDSRFPGACSNGNPISDTATQKDATPQTTAADVKLEMIVDQKQLEEYVKQESETTADSEATTVNEATTENAESASTNTTDPSKS